MAKQIQQSGLDLALHHSTYYNIVNQQMAKALSLTHIICKKAPVSLCVCLCVYHYVYACLHIYMHTDQTECSQRFNHH